MSTPTTQTDQQGKYFMPHCSQYKNSFDFRKTTISIHDFNLGEDKKSEHHMTTLAGVILDL